MQVARQYINGAWVSSTAGKERIEELRNPATGEIAGRCALGSLEDGVAAVAAARRAFDESGWKHDARLRAEVLLGFADRLDGRKDAIADLLVALNGKTRREALGEILAGISELRYYAGVARNLFGRIIESAPGCYSSLDREALGVVAIILPWNAPVALLLRSLAPALAAGCSAVIKPAVQTCPVNNMVLECLAADGRVPAGIVNSVVGPGISRYLCEAVEVDGVSFTGSTEVGKQIAAQAAGTLKRLSLELGGKAPGLVFADADLDAGIPAIVAGALIQTGQQCTALARVLVEDSVYDEVARRLKETLAGWRVGFGHDPASQMGCLIDMENRDRVNALLDLAERTEQVLLRGEIPGGELAGGAFIRPSLVAVSDLDSPFVQNELFGPILVIERFRDEADAVRRANATRFGLAASVWTRDGLRAKRLASRLKFGTVWLNTHNRLFAEIETGGYRESGVGRLHGLEALNDFMHTKHFFYEAGI